MKVRVIAMLLPELLIIFFVFCYYIMCLTGFNIGFWEFFIIVLVVGSGYLCLALCLAEMTSFLPFAGSFVHIVPLNMMLL